MYGIHGAPGLGIVDMTHDHGTLKMDALDGSL